ncbi:twin-arginine translocase subunit TatC [Flavobacterium sp. HXWNR69]|uniref:Sec-independent protein translocase protein TatC n=1 Tax=Flavobacterium fragile TaxID=2949085 RepID=A0ABT0TFK8_9FLAO|nr:twin-arginine translocase subunit TatC [Flavobacterium sp. HXWNR69]MCL9769766.1 twin-arginine translocase subunit TatC [Flavobacterium sp. HXWNR69]
MAEKNMKEMSFLDHLEELRWLLVRSTVAILIGATVAFFFSDFIFNDIIFGPKSPDFITYQFFCDLSTQLNISESFCVKELPFEIQNTDIEGQVSLLIWTCITAGFIIAFPYMLLQLWNFISPALYEKEKKYAKAFIFVSSLLFFMGILFGYFVIVPMSVNFFATFNVSPEIKNDINVQSYIGMIKTSVIACGLIFELPIIIYFLSKIGLITPEFLRKYRKYAIVLILIVAAIATPPDVVSQIVVSIPLLVLYEISIFISALVVKNKEKEKEKANT